MSILEIITQCKSVLSKGKLDLAINLLLNSGIEDEELSEEIILLSSRFERMNTKHLAGRINNDEADIQFAKIDKALIKILKEMESLHLCENESN